MPERKENMDYMEFREKISEGLKDFYGSDASVRIHKIYKNNDVAKYGVAIQFTADGEDSAVPLIYLEGLYSCYSRGILDMDGCMGEIISSREKPLKEYGGIEEMSLNIKGWGYAKNNVYPALLPARDNKKLLKGLVSTGMLDLAVIYIIRGKSEDGGFTSIKITSTLLGSYGISKEELHRQALYNARNDGYRLYGLEEVVGAMVKDEPFTEGIKETGCIAGGMMYVMTNRAMFYGTAGILDSQWMYEKTRGTSCYIIPSSIHELIFVPDNGEIGQEELDKMVLEANSSVIEDGEKLSDHCYYYDAAAGETRIRK